MMKKWIISLIATVVLLLGCSTTPFQASNGMLLEGNALFAQGRYPQASAVYKRCLEIEQNPACLYNIGMMIETSRYNDPDPAVRASMYADGKTPRGRAVQYYHLAARYDQPDAIAALKRLNRAVPPADLAQAMQAQSQGAQMNPATQQSLMSLAGVVGCMLAGGTSCGGAAFTPPPQQDRQTHEQWQPQPLPQHSQPYTAQRSQSTSSVQGLTGTSVSCVLNADCTHPATCMKAPGSRRGICAVEVNSGGVQTHGRSGVGVACRLDSECGFGFRCERPMAPSQPGVCVQR